MKIFDVVITEELTRTMPVVADSIEEAEKKIRDKYTAGKIVLDSSDYIGTEFYVK